MQEIATANQSKTVITRERRFQIDYGDIVRYFAFNGITVPLTAKMTIILPNGDDPSGKELFDIGWIDDEKDNRNIISVEWTETKEIDV